MLEKDSNSKKKKRIVKKEATINGKKIEKNKQDNMINSNGMSFEEAKLALDIAVQQSQRGATPANGWQQINRAEVLRVQEAIMAETGQQEWPTAEQTANFFNSHGVDSHGQITINAMPVLPGDGTGPGSSMNSYFAGFAAVAAILYYFKKRNCVDDEDGLF